MTDIIRPNIISKKKLIWPWLCLLLLLTGNKGVSSWPHPPSNTSEMQVYLDEQTELADRLLEAYDKRFIPAIKKKPLQVELEIVVSDVLKIDDMESEMTVYIRQRWFDKRLSWNSTKILKSFLKIREHFLHKIWLPDIRIINLKEIKRFDGFGGINMNVYPDGRVYLSQLFFIKTSCLMDLHDFPMDRQTCFLNFSSYAYGKDLLNFSLSAKKIDVQPVNLPQFTFVEAKEVSDNQKGKVSKVRVALIFQRRAGFYIIHIYIPSIFLVILSWLTFLMESQNIADRLALEIALVLSIVFLLGGSNSAVSRVSYAKASDWFVIVSFAFIFCALLENMFVYRVSTLKIKWAKKHACGYVSFLGKHLSKLLGKSKTVQMNQGHHTEADQTVTTEACRRLENEEDSHNLGEFVDRISILLFPFFYVVFNVLYWWYYY